MELFGQYVLSFEIMATCYAHIDGRWRKVSARLYQNPGEPENGGPGIAGKTVETVNIWIIRVGILAQKF